MINMSKRITITKKVISTLILAVLILSNICRVFAINKSEEISYKYLISEKNKTVSRIEPETEMPEFRQNINVEKSKIHVYKDAQSSNEVTSGYLKTGMVLRCDDVDDMKDAYELVVIGDLNGDGLMDQIDLNILIKHVVGYSKNQLSGLPAIAADILSDEAIDQIDITILIRYIVYHELDLPGIDKTAPKLDVTVKTTTKSITVYADATDEESGVKEYIYYIGEVDEDGNVKWEEGVKSREPQHTFDNLDPDKEYKVKVEVKDKSGNSTTSDPVDAKLVPSGVKGITAKSSNTNWTNQDVEMTATSKYPEYRVQTSTNNTDWTDNASIIYEQNGKFYARLTDGTSAGEEVEFEITNIDKVPPTDMLSETQITSKSISQTINVTDADSGLGKIQVYYRKKGETTYQVKEETYQEIHGSVAGEKNASKTIKLENLKNGTYEVYVVITDVAGNTTNVDGHNADNPKEIDLENIPEGSTGITITPSTTGWTKEPITVTIKNSNDKYTLETKKDTDDDWGDSTTITMDENGKIEARLTDGTNAGEKIELVIGNIDKGAPTGTVSCASKTTESMNITVNASDSLSGIGKVIWYYQKEGSSEKKSKQVDYATINGTSKGRESVTETQTFNNLTTGTYNVYAEITDVAGNVITTSTIKVVIDEVPTGTENLKLTSNPTSWTKENVVVTATTTTGLTIQTSLDGTSWETVSQQTATQYGQVVYARLTDGVNHGEPITLTVDNIDKEVPVIVEEIEVTQDLDTETVSINANLEDAKSGLYRVVTYYKKSTESQYKKFSEGHFEGDSYVMDSTGEVESEVAYNFYIEVFDKVGNKSESSVVTYTTY